MALALVVALACSGESDDPPPIVETGAPSAPLSQTDAFVVAPPAATDILFVIDDSCSMANEQEALGENVPTLLTRLEELATDWHIGVITTDVDFQSGLLQSSGRTTYVTPAIANPVGTMVSLFSRGVAGSPDASPTAAIYAALGPDAPPDNRGFYRATASLHIIVITDDSDASRSFDLPPEGFPTWLEGLKTKGETVTFSSIVDPDNGAEFLGLTRAIGGFEVDISDPDWPAMYDRLANQVEDIPTTFELSEPPVPETLTVAVVRDGQTMDLDSEDWTYDAATATLRLTAFELELGDEIRIVYQLAPDSR